jgi:rfaE bifunctional protein nucleotidyltransferase chain/domain
VSGCFDLLHPGHIRLLEQARSHGDILIVGLQSDAGVRAGDAGVKNSGSSGAERSPRPISPAAERVEILAALAAVDYVVEFDEPSCGHLIGRLSPDIVVEGASPRVDLPDEVEPWVSEAPKPKRVRILLEPGYSTMLLIERITQAGA